MKKLNLKKVGFIVIPLLLLIPGIMIVKSVSSSSSRIVLKDQQKIDKIILHDAKGDHACDCWPPQISSWEIKNVTDTSASFRWLCSSQSSYQVNYGTTSGKGTRYPATRPTVLYKDYTVTVTGLKPSTNYYAGPVSKDPNYSGAGGEKTFVGRQKTANSFPFTTLAASTTYSIGGNIIDNTGAGISGVTVTLSGDSSATVTTTSNGSYAFAKLKQGKNYKITPTKTNYSFTPPNTNYSSLAANKTADNYVGQIITAVMINYSEQPLIYNVTASKITTRDATVTWKTNIPSTSEVEYGTTKNYGLKSGENTELARDHYIQLFDLTPGTTYYFRTISKTGLSKTSSFSSDFSITTLLIEKRIADKIHYFTEPNPCADRVEFHYYLYQQINNLTIDILTLSGKKVAVLESPSSALVMGWNRLAWDVRDRSGTPLVNGLYVYVMRFTKGSTEDVLERSQFMVRR